MSLVTKYIFFPVYPWLMKVELQRLWSSVEAMTTASVESLVQRLSDYSLHPLSDFSKFDAFALMETVHNTAHVSVTRRIITAAWHMRPFLQRLISCQHFFVVCYCILSVIKTMRRCLILSIKWKRALREINANGKVQLPGFLTLVVVLQIVLGVIIVNNQATFELSVCGTRGTWPHSDLQAMLQVTGNNLIKINLSR